MYGSFSDYTNNSSWGKLKGASKEKGKVLVEKAIEVIVQFDKRESRNKTLIVFLIDKKLDKYKTKEKTKEDCYA